MMHRIATLAALATAILLAGCASSRGPYATPSESDRNPLEAQRLNALAAAILEQVGDAEPNPPGAHNHAEQLARTAEQLARAELLLREALATDIYCGPAHNNLGIVYLTQSPAKLYEAASEFEWARKLMPGHPDPRMNLALTLERAGKFDDAISAYRTALEASCGHIQSMQALARLQVKHRRTDDTTSDYLREIALRGDARWSEWARGMLARGTPALRR